MKKRIPARIIHLVVFFVLLLMNYNSVYAQTRILKGLVQDISNDPLIGATILVKGTDKGCVTDIDGVFEIEVNPSQTLVVSYIGYISQEIKITNQVSITITLKEQDTALDELIVVGYGTQTKRNVVGAVAQIGNENLTNRPNANVVRSMQGQIPGVNIVMNDGKPSRNSSIQIRGAVNSIGAGGSALILIDGVEGDLTALNPDDVESISVLKDASSCAIYGARGAFGVVLVSTKNAKEGKTKINYSSSISVLSRTNKPNLVTNGLEWYQSYYESYYGAMGKNPASINNIFPWNEDWVRELEKRAADDSYEDWRVNSSGKYEYFGNTDWHDIVYKNHTTSQQHNISLSGGGKKSNYFISGRFFKQNGIYNSNNENYKQFNLRAKGSLQVTDWLQLSNNTDFVRRRFRQPRVSYMYQDRMLTINRMLEHQGYPLTLEKNPDGSWTEASVYSGWAGFVEGDTYQDNFKFDIKNTTSLTAEIIKDRLIANADFTYLFGHSEQDRVNNQHEFSNGPGLKALREEYSDFEHRSYKTNYLAANATLTYKPNFGTSHRVSLLGGWNIEDKEYIRTLQSRDGLLVPSKPNFSLMDGTNYTIRDLGSYSWGFVGVFFRGTYSYLGKYLAEISGRYDGTSKFPKNEQWGFFPSASFGWRISDENFMKPYQSWLENFKLRLSIGSAGNGLIDPYKYLSTMNIKKSSTILTNGEYESYTSSPIPIPNSLTWEKVTTYDAGLDLDLFKGRLNIQGDYYKKYTKDMYVTGPELPAVAGYAAPKGNYANMQTNGWEFSIGWNDQIEIAGKNLSYNIRFSMWDSKSWITKYTSTLGTLPSIYSNNYYEGMRVGEIWGYHVLGLFESDEEAKSWGAMQTNTFKLSNANIPMAGDLKFADLDNSGSINNGSNTIDNHGDLTKIGNTTPRYSYGVNLGANWNNIGVSMFWQGVGQKDWYPAKESSYFWGHYGRSYGFGLPWQNEDHRWTEQNQDHNAYWPRLRGYSAQWANGQMSTPNDRYIQNAAYLRLKNITLDYTLPRHILSRLNIEAVKLYISGENLLTFTPLSKHAKNFDPEGISAGDQDFNSSAGKEGDGYGYPQLKSITFGINLSF